MVYIREMQYFFSDRIQTYKSVYEIHVLWT